MPSLAYHDLAAWAEFPHAAPGFLFGLEGSWSQEKTQAGLSTGLHVRGGSCGGVSGILWASVSFGAEFSSGS